MADLARHFETLHVGNPHRWQPDQNHGMTLDAWLKKYPPSSTTTIDNWLWVRGASWTANAAEGESETKALEEAAKMCDDAKDRIPAVGDHVPYSAAGQQLKEDLIELATKSGSTHGKWLIFAHPQQADLWWNEIAPSVVDGPLSKLGLKINTAKVKARPIQAYDEDHARVITIYFQDCHNKDDARKVLQCLLESHGILPKCVKSDFFSKLGIYYQNELGLGASLYRLKDLTTQMQTARWRAHWVRSLEEARKKEAMELKEKVAAEESKKEVQQGK